jgi:hypothetical protein
MEAATKSMCGPTKITAETLRGFFDDSFIFVRNFQLLDHD